MANPPDINYMPSSKTPGGQVVVIAGDPPVTVALSENTLQTGEVTINLKRLRAVRVGGATGASGSFILSGPGSSPTMMIPVPVSPPGTTIVEEFPVPFRATQEVFLEIQTGMGNWAVVTIGFYSA